MKVQAQTKLQPVGCISPLPLSMVIPFLSLEGNIQEKCICHRLELHPGAGESTGLQCSFLQVKTTLQVPDQGGRDICHIAVLGFYRPFLGSALLFLLCNNDVLEVRTFVFLSCNPTDMTALTLSSGSFHFKWGILLWTRAGQYTFTSPEGITG